MSSSLFDSFGVDVASVGPRCVFVVVAAVLDAAVHDADPTVRECSQRHVVRVAIGAALVVEESGSGAPAQRAERTLVEGVGEATVAHESGEHNRSCS